MRLITRSEVQDKVASLRWADVAGRKLAQKLTGGVGDNRSSEDFDPEALAEGQKVEKEHTSDPSVAREIAMDHLTEDPHYYKKLRAMVEPHEHEKDASIELAKQAAALLLDLGMSKEARPLIAAKPVRSVVGSIGNLFKRKTVPAVAGAASKPVAGLPHGAPAPSPAAAPMTRQQGFQQYGKPGALDASSASNWDNDLTIPSYRARSAARPQKGPVPVAQTNSVAPKPRAQVVPRSTAGETLPGPMARTTAAPGPAAAGQVAPGPAAPATDATRKVIPLSELRGMPPSPANKPRVISLNELSGAQAAPRTVNPLQEMSGRIGRVGDNPVAPLRTRTPDRISGQSDKIQIDPAYAAATEAPVSGVRSVSGTINPAPSAAGQVAPGPVQPAAASTTTPVGQVAPGPAAPTGKGQVSPGPMRDPEQMNLFSRGVLDPQRVAAETAAKKAKLAPGEQVDMFNQPKVTPEEVAAHTGSSMGGDAGFKAGRTKGKKGGKLKDRDASAAGGGGGGGEVPPEQPPTGGTPSSPRRRGKKGKLQENPAWMGEGHKVIPQQMPDGSTRYVHASPDGKSRLVDKDTYDSFMKHRQGSFGQYQQGPGGWEHVTPDGEIRRLTGEEAARAAAEHAELTGGGKLAPKSDALNIPWGKALGLGALGAGAYGLYKSVPWAVNKMEEANSMPLAYGGGWSPTPYGYGHSPYSAGMPTMGAGA